MQDIRNCNGISERGIFHQIEFEKCPISYLKDNPDYQHFFDLYISCVGGQIFDATGSPAPIIHLPFSGAIMDQPNDIMLAFRIISATLGDISKNIFKNGRE